jgi:hypothetical protein
LENGRKSEDPIACSDIDICRKPFLGKPGLEDLQQRVSEYKGDASKILESVSLYTKGQLSSFPFPPLSLQHMEFQSGALKQGWKGEWISPLP